MRYFCEECNRQMGESVCSECGTRGTLLSDATGENPPADGGDAVPVPALPQPRRRERVEEAGDVVPELPRAARESNGAGEVGALAAERPAPVATPRDDALSPLVQDGDELFLLAGVAGAGKSQLIRALAQWGRAQPNARRKLRYSQQPQVMSTPTGQIEYVRVELEPRQSVLGRRTPRTGLLVDAAGEDFKVLYPGLGGPAVNEAFLERLRPILPRLRGLVALIDLQQLWAPDPSRTPDQQAPGRHQVEIALWVIDLVRWFQAGYTRVKRGLLLEEQVCTDLVSVGKLSIPVLVLFSRADQLVGLPTPRAAGGRPLVPVEESPFFLAQAALPDLYSELVARTSHFRFDFAHSIVTEEVSGRVTEDESCGVGSSMEWLLSADFCEPWPNLSTSFWIRLQRQADRLVGRGKRWRGLAGARRPA